MELKLDRGRFMPDSMIVKDAYIHPKLVKKRPENSLNLPKVHSQKHVPIACRGFDRKELTKMAVKIERAYCDYETYEKQKRQEGSLLASLTKPSSAKPLLADDQFCNRVYSKLELDRR